MSPNGLARKIASQLLPHDKNRKLISPPGSIPQGEGRPVLVKSKMRTGTHLLIDLILNNFPQLRTESLYVELDHAALLGIPAERFQNLKKCLCKTHYGGRADQELSGEITEVVTQKAFIIEPVRPLEEMNKSLQTFLGHEKYQEYLIESQEFDEYWAGRECLEIPFADLICKQGNERSIKKIANYIGEIPSEKRFYNPAKSQAKQVLLDKLFTRLLGVKKRRVNTTIHFNG